MDNESAAQDGTGKNDTKLSSTGERERSAPRRDRALTENLDGMADAFFILDRQRCVTYLNSQAATFLALNKAALAESNLWEAAPELVGSPLYYNIERGIEEGTASCFDALYPTPGRWFESRVYPCNEGVTVIAYDITAQKQAKIVDISRQKKVEEALKLSRERFDLVIEAVNLGLWYCDLPFDKLIWNDQCKEHFGLPVDVEVTIDMFYELLHPDDREHTRLAIAEAIANHSEYNLDFRTVSPIDGRMRWIRAMGRAFYDEQGQPVRFDGIMTDVTDRKRDEEKLREQAELLNLAHDAIMILDLENRIIFWNPGAEELYGWSFAEAQGKTASRLLHTQSVPSLEVITESVLVLGRWEGELTHQHRDGSSIVVDSRWALLRDEHNAPVAILEINRDITERKEVELRKDEFISLVSHELRTPITTIKGNIQLAQRRLQNIARQANALPGEVNRYTDDALMLLERALRQTSVQNRLIGDLLDVSRIRADKLELTFDDCDLVDVVRAIVEDHRHLAASRTILFEPPASESVLVLADKDRIGQVVSNYLSNALKYSPPEEPISVGLEVRGEYARVWVRDRGVGLSPEMQEQVWGRFYQTPGTEVKSGSRIGLGLGLYISRTLVQRHGGEAGVDSVPGQGSEFWFTLPISQ